MFCGIKIGEAPIQKTSNGDNSVSSTAYTVCASARFKLLIKSQKQEKKNKSCRCMESVMHAPCKIHTYLTGKHDTSEKQRVHFK